MDFENYLEKNRTRRRNAVEQFMNTFNRPQTQRDRKNDYRRHDKFRVRYERETDYV